MKIAELHAAGVIPRPIVEKLTRLIRRVRWLIVLRGACAVAATAVGALLAVMAIDACVTLFSLWTRGALTLSVYAATAIVAVFFLVRPLAKSFSLTGIARVIETRHPELQERISSAVELITSEDAPDLRGSEQLIGALVEQATDNVRDIQPRREVTLRAARPYLAAATVVVAVLAAMFVLWPEQASFLLRRASVPFINLPNLQARDLHVSPGNVVILEGDRLQVEVEVPNRAVRSASFRCVQPDGSEAVADMVLLYSGSDPTPRFAFTCPPATQTFQYRVHAGDALTSFYTASVEKRPAIEQLEVRYESPKYAHREPLTESPAEGDLRALQGTVITLTAHTNKPMAAAELLINGQPAAAKAELAAKGEGAPAALFRFTLTPEVVGRWALQLTDQHGFKSYSAEHAIEIVPDAPPTITVLTSETKQLRLPPTARVPVSYAVEDDIGLSGVAMLIEVDGRAQPSRSVALPAQAKGPVRAATGEAALQLATLDLRNAKYVTVQLRATDNCPKEFKGPHHGVSDLYRIELDVRAPSFAASQLMDQERKLKESLEQVKKDLQRAKHDSERLKEDLPKSKEPTENDTRRIDDMQKKLTAADSGARKVAQEMQGGYFEKLAEKVKALADDHIAKAENLAGQIKLADQAAERGTLAKETDRVIDRALKAVDELLKEVEPVSDVVRKALEMQEMAQREADLAREKLAAAEQANMTPEEWQKAQEALAHEVGDMLKDTPGAQQAALKADQKAAENLANEARQMAQEQQALAGQNDQLGKIQQIDKALGALAEEQQKLAKEAAAGAATQAQAPQMGKAAEDIQAGNLAPAVGKQAAAENALNQAAQQMAQGQPAAAPQGQPGADQAQPAAAPQNAEQVADLAKRQGELREKTEDLLGQRQEAVAEHQQGQMDRLQAEQAQVAQEAAALAENVGNAAPQADNLQNQAAAAAARAADALGANQMPQAAQNANQAGNQLGELANRLEAAAAQPFAGQPAGDQAPPAGNEAAGQPQPAGNEAGDQAQPAGNEAGAQAQPAGNEGAGQPQPAGNEGAGQPQPAANQGGNAPPPGGQPGAQVPQLAQQAAGLAERQQQLANEMQALAGANPLAQAAAQQSALAERAADLAQAAGALQQQAEQLGAGQAPAAQAAANLGQAQQQANAAAGELAAAAGVPAPGTPAPGTPAPGPPAPGAPGPGTPAPSSAAPAQQAAANAMNAAADALASLGQAMGAAASQAPSAAPGQPGPGQMAQAYSSASQAAAAQSGMAAAEAAGQMSAMATSAASTAQAMGGSLQTQPKPGDAGNPNTGTGVQSTDLSEAKLKELGIKLEDWARLPGELRDQILQAAVDQGPEEYRPLIKRYFQELARRGSAESEKTEKK